MNRFIPFVDNIVCNAMGLLIICVFMSCCFRFSPNVSISYCEFCKCVYLHCTPVLIRNRGRICPGFTPPLSYIHYSMCNDDVVAGYSHLLVRSCIHHHHMHYV